jgi:hypothetical protein
MILRASTALLAGSLWVALWWLVGVAIEAFRR